MQRVLLASLLLIYLQYRFCLEHSITRSPHNVTESPFSALVADCLEKVTILYRLLIAPWLGGESRIQVKPISEFYVEDSKYCKFECEDKS